MTEMKQYLLSIYQPDGDPPPPTGNAAERAYLALAKERG
jgi:hypothetical protein